MVVLEGWVDDIGVCFASGLLAEKRGWGSEWVTATVGNADRSNVGLEWGAQSRSSKAKV
jgi:hypothetical protein